MHFRVVCCKEKEGRSQDNSSSQYAFPAVCRRCCAHTFSANLLLIQALRISGGAHLVQQRELNVREDSDSKL